MSARDLMKGGLMVNYKVPWWHKAVCYFFGHNIFQTHPARWQCARCQGEFYVSS